MRTVTGVIASQINFLRCSIVGDNAEDLKIQEEFVEDIETAPIIGHGFSEIAGYMGKTKEIALNATKNTAQL